MDGGYLNRTVRKDFIYYLGKQIHIGNRRPKLKGGAFSLFREKFEQVNGFDETFIGWGREDDDLGRRLYLANVIGRNISHRAWTYHLWHEPTATKSAQFNYDKNDNKKYTRKNIEPEIGLKQYPGDEVKVVCIN